jgi:hypothetical protein
LAIPRETQKSTDLGDDYKVYQKPGQCPGVAYIVKGRSARNGLAYCGSASALNPASVSSWTVEIPNKIKGIKKILYETRPRYQTRANGTCNTIVTQGTIGFYFSYIDYEGLTNPYTSPGSLIYFYENWLSAELSVIDSINRKDNLADNCGNWIIDIYKNGSVIQSDEGGLLLPSVSWNCQSINQCPPNTCDVLCGNTICCYNSDGISVFNYPNT